MASFRNDYSFVGHPRILAALSKYQDENNVAYGLDIHSETASKYIKDIFDVEDSSVFFLAGGTQTNMVFISYCLKNFEAVISCDTGHINVHEAGAVESTGHKIITVKNDNGKLNAQNIEDVMGLFVDEHMVKPGLIYISNSTELGTIYHKDELLELRKVADKYGLILFIDGARLGSALTSKENDVDHKLLGSIADAFYVGGTKNGLLFGEALVIKNKILSNDFRHHIKNKGAMLAKGYAVGIQFEEVFKDGLYFELAKHTNDMADKLKEVLINNGLDILPSPTNQIFVKTNKNLAKALIEKFDLEKWSEDSDSITVRFVTSFQTTIDDIKEVYNFLKIK